MRRTTLNTEAASVSDVPDSPEGVAFALLQLILQATETGAKERLLSLYRECHDAVIGYTPGPFKREGDPVHH